MRSLSDLPIIFFHPDLDGSYLEFSLAQSRIFLPRSRIFLLANQVKPGLPDLTLVHASNFFSRARQFSEICQPHAKTSCQFDPKIFHKWYVLLEIMEKYRLDQALICNSAVMLFHDFSQLHTDNPSLLCGLSLGPARKPNGNPLAAPHFSYWQRAGLKAFCAFNLQILTNHALHRLQPGLEQASATPAAAELSDIDTLSWFYADMAADHRLNFTEILDDSVVDLDIGVPDNYLPEEFLRRDGRKKIVFHDGQPYGFHLPTQTEIRFKALHCRGVNKWLIPGFCQATQRRLPARFRVFTRYRIKHLGQRLGKLVR